MESGNIFLEIPPPFGVFGINHHRANSKTTSTQVDKWSAGCQVQPNPVLFDIDTDSFLS